MKAEYVNPGHLPASPYLRRDERFELAMLQALTPDDE
jgi:hypothetical protein